MFKAGDILKANMDIAESVYEGCKGTTVYQTMMKLAQEKRYEVLNFVNGQYVIRHLDTDPLVESQHDKAEVHQYFVLDSEQTTIPKEER